MSAGEAFSGQCHNCSFFSLLLKGDDMLFTEASRSVNRLAVSYLTRGATWALFLFQPVETELFPAP